MGLTMHEKKQHLFLSMQEVKFNHVQEENENKKKKNLQGCLTLIVGE